VKRLKISHKIPSSALFAQKNTVYFVCFSGGIRMKNTHTLALLL